MSRFALAALAALTLAATGSAADPPPPVGTRVADFTLPDAATGQPWSLAEKTRSAKATVVVFLGTSCPVSNAYCPRLADLAKRFAADGVVFVGVNSHAADDTAAVAAHAKTHNLPFPVLKDDGTKLADKLAVDRVPTAVVLDGTRTVRYAGRIDDQYAPGVQRPRPGTRELAAAVEAITDGTEVRVTHAPAAGCLLTREKGAKPAGEPVTYTKQVSRIIQARCQECHRPGEAAPFALMSYKQAKGWADMIREVVTDGVMPPWHADAPPGHFANDRRLTADEKRTLLAWVDQGCPEGDPTDAPPPRTYLTGWRLPKEPDAVLRMNKPVRVPAHGLPVVGMDYQYVMVGEPFAEEKWVKAVEVRPEYREVVHHIIAFMLPPGVTMDDPRSVGRVLSGRNFGANMIGTYVPGDQPIVFPDGFARRVPKGSRILFEVHYTPNGRAGTDRSMIGLSFADGPPKHEIHWRSVPNERLQIPPGAADHEVKSWHVFETPATILAFAPHMHLRGKAFRFDLQPLNGPRATALNVPKYDFNWQATYFPATPIEVPAGTLLECTARFDNSTGNPANPDPTKTVTWGKQTWQEMMIGFVMYYDTPRPARFGVAR